MTRSGASQSPAGQARRVFALHLEAALPTISDHLLGCARAQLPLDGPSGPGQRRDHRARLLAENLPAWVRGMVHELRVGLEFGWLAQDAREQAPPAGQDAQQSGEWLAFRLAVAVLDRARGQFEDLRTRVTRLEQVEDLETRDFLKPDTVARLAVRAWEAAELPLEIWQDLQPSLHDAFAMHLEQAYHAANEWLVDHGVMPEIHLRALRDDALTPPEPVQGLQEADGSGDLEGAVPKGRPWPDSAHQAPAVSDSGVGATVTQRLSNYGVEGSPAQGTPVQPTPPAPPSNKLLGALQRLGALAGSQPTGVPAETAFQATVMDSAHAVDAAAGAATVAAPLQETGLPGRQWRQGPATQEERTTLEIVALMFHGILAEERVPAPARVWFARLQTPVLRVALTEPELFASPDHPTRRLIDRMGACVLGFGRKGPAGDESLETEIKRIVQVVEAYPDSGRRVFQTVLGEFESFLESYDSEHTETGHRSVSLAQQLEQRETLAIQNTIEFRRLLEGEPVQDGVRQFLFDVWADVLATVTVSKGPSNERTRAMKRVAGDLIWSAGAKVTREDRADVLRRLPALLKTIREGMSIAGTPAERQEDLIKKLNDSLTEGFTAKAAPLPQRKLQDLTEQLESLEEMLPENLQIDIDESFVRDIPGASDTALEVVVDGGGEPIAAMLSWARELPVGSWYMLKHGGAERPVQLVWQGTRRLLALFVAADGQCKLFQLRRLAAYLQSGLIQPAQDDDLTIKGIRGTLDILSFLPKPPAA
jgi:uncharacterized coiled-coil protein SlyX